MPQIQGPQTSSGGRLDGSLATALSASNVALGVGWGDGTLVLSIVAGSNCQRGSLTVTSVGSNQAQATATVTITFPEGAYASTPFALVNLQDNTSNVNNIQPTDVACTTTALSWTHCVIPVDTKTYTYAWHVVA
jgi:hypothetical protein